MATTAADLPRIALIDLDRGHTSQMPLGAFTTELKAKRWTRVRVPLARFTSTSLKPFAANRSSLALYTCVRSFPLGNKPLRYRKRPPKPERPGSQLQPGSRLLPFVLTAIHQRRNCRAVDRRRCSRPRHGAFARRRLINWLRFKSDALHIHQMTRRNIVGSHIATP